MTIDQAREWLRIDGTDNDEIVKSLLDGAKVYIYQATGILETDQDSNPLAVTCQKFLLSLWYNPDQSEADKLQRTIDNLLKSLSY